MTKWQNTVIYAARLACRLFRVVLYLQCIKYKFVAFLWNLYHIYILWNLYQLLQVRFLALVTVHEVELLFCSRTEICYWTISTLWLGNSAVNVWVQSSTFWQPVWLDWIIVSVIGSTDIPLWKELWINSSQGLFFTCPRYLMFGCLLFTFDSPWIYL